MDKMKNVKPLTDLELYELMVTAYPERFDENADDDIWDDVMDFVDDQFGCIDELSELLARVTLMASPMVSVINGVSNHCLGKMKIVDNTVRMTACVQRQVSITQNKD